MQNQPYETPVMRKLGSVKDLTKGAGGDTADGSGAGGSFVRAIGGQGGSIL
jgi:hypothetical protein